MSRANDPGKDLGPLGNIAMHAVKSRKLLPFRIKLSVEAVTIVVKSLKELLEELELQEPDEALTFLLVSDYGKKEALALYKKNPQLLCETARVYQAIDRAEEIVADIRQRQFTEIHQLCLTQYPILANQCPRPQDLLKEKLPEKLEKLYLKDVFSEEEFVRAYLDNTASAKVYDLTAGWQTWAAEQGLHPAFPKVEPQAKRIRKASPKKEPEEKKDVIDETDDRLIWATSYLGDNKEETIRSLNFLIETGFLSPDFDEATFTKLKTTTTYIFTRLFSHPDEPPVKRSGRGRKPLSGKERKLAQRIRDARKMGTGYDIIADEFSVSLKEILKTKKGSFNWHSIEKKDLIKEAKRLNDAARKWE